MNELMETKEIYFANSESGAEDLLNRLKNEATSDVKQSSIVKKTKKELEYFVVSITFIHSLEKELFENM